MCSLKRGLYFLTGLSLSTLHGPGALACTFVRIIWRLYELSYDILHKKLKQKRVIFLDDHKQNICCVFFRCRGTLLGLDLIVKDVIVAPILHFLKVVIPPMMTPKRIHHPDLAREGSQGNGKTRPCNKLNIIRWGLLLF